jgi:hypothetical protein
MTIYSMILFLHIVGALVLFMTLGYMIQKR